MADPDSAGRTLLDVVLTGLPTGADVVVVGPERPTRRLVRFVQEHPGGGGPAAALVAGLRLVAAIEPGRPGLVADGVVAVVPGDAPAAGLALDALRRALEAGAEAAVAVDRRGRDQVLQLALTATGVERLLEAAGRHSSLHGAAVRPLVQALQPVRVPVPALATWDVDTPEQLVTWQLVGTPGVDAVVRKIEGCQGARRRAGDTRPVVMAVDGRSGAGKSVLAAAVALRTDGTVLEGDDFYSPRLAREGVDAAEQHSSDDLSRSVVDWRRLRAEGLEPLVAGRPAAYRRYDWHADDGSLEAHEVTVHPAPVVVVDGVYSARPELDDLVDVRVLVRAPEQVRAERLARRGEDDPRWAAVWSRAEQHHLGVVSPPERFDVVVGGHPAPALEGP